MSRPMNCRQVRGRKQAYVDGRLPAGEHQAVADHLVQCSDCLAQVALARRVQQELGPTVHQALGEPRLSPAAESRIRARLWAALDPDPQPAPWVRRLAWGTAPALTALAVLVLVWAATALLGAPLPPVQQAFVTPPASAAPELAASAVAVLPPDTPAPATVAPSPPPPATATQAPAAPSPPPPATATQAPAAPALTVAPTEAAGTAVPTVAVTQPAPTATRSPDVIAVGRTPTTTASTSWAYYLKGESVTRVARQEAHVWAGTTQGQVVHLTIAGEVARYALTSAKPVAVTGLAIDAQGVVWAATRGAGVFVLTADAGPARALNSAGLPSSDISALTIDATGGVWCSAGATVSHLVLRAGSPPITATQASYDWQTFVVPVPRSDAGAHQVTALAAEGDDTLWVGVRGSYRSEQGAYLDGGLYRLRLGPAPTWEQVLYANEVGIVQAIHIESNGQKWVATGPTGDPDDPQALGGGVAVWAGQDWRFYEALSVGMPSRSAADVAVDARGRTWIATDRGLAIYTGPQVALYQARPAGLPSNHVQALALGADGGAWLGTDVGLCHTSQP